MTERQQLLEEAKTLGLKFAANAKTETVKSAVEEARNSAVAEEALIEAGAEAVAKPTEQDIRAQLEAEFKELLEAEKVKLAANMEVNMALKNNNDSNGRMLVGQAKLKARREALKLVRVVVTCKDPLKAAWDGEILTGSNDVVGDVKKYVPFDIDEGYHLPQILVNILKSKECTVFKRKKGADGRYVQEAKLIKAYNVEELEPLTEDELAELSRAQLAAAGKA